MQSINASLALRIVGTQLKRPRKNFSKRAGFRFSFEDISSHSRNLRSVHRVIHKLGAMIEGPPPRLPSYLFSTSCKCAGTHCPRQFQGCWDRHFTGIGYISVKGTLPPFHVTTSCLWCTSLIIFLREVMDFRDFRHCRKAMATILIVDDNDTNREMLTDALGQHKTVEARDGAEAL